LSERFGQPYKLAERECGKPGAAKATIGNGIWPRRNAQKNNLQIQKQICD